MNSGSKIPPEIIQTFRDARDITILTGAGISAESGIPTFRASQTGLWAKYNPEDLATPDAFCTNPELVWRWYRWRQEIINQAQPNHGHIALSQMESYLKNNGSQITIITQNVDGLHQRAGNKNIIELHGNIYRRKCFDCGTASQDALKTTNEHPHCSQCGGLLRPDVVWFGENIPEIILRAAYDSTLSCDMFFSIGTSAVVQPAASLPVIALQNGAALIELNLNSTPITTLAVHSIRGQSGEILPHLVKTIWPMAVEESKP